MKYLLLFIPFLLVSCWKVITEQQWIEYCKLQWKELNYKDPYFLWFDQESYINNVHCKESKYEQCLYKLNNTFSDLSDTWGNNTNNQDSISKTIQSEIDRCIKNI